MSSGRRVMLLLLFVMPLLNYVSSQIFLLQLPDMPLLTTVLASLNGVGLAIAWVLLLAETNNRLNLEASESAIPAS